MSEGIGEDYSWFYPEVMDNLREHSLSEVTREQVQTYLIENSNHHIPTEIGITYFIKGAAISLNGDIIRLSNHMPSEIENNLLNIIQGETKGDIN